jgi:pyruvate dehydrogenase E2 component (dihydrolipoamide acetyltransferase)
MSERRVEVPDIGDATDVDVVEVLVQPGATVQVDQGLVVLESEKASMEVPSPAAGKVKDVVIKVGDKVSKGSLILVLDGEGDAAQAAPEKSDESPGKTDREPKPPPAKAKAERAPEQAPAKKPRAAETPEPAEADDEAEADDDEAKGDDEADFADEEKQRDPAAASNAGAAARRTVPPPTAPVPSIGPPPSQETQPHATPSVRKLARELGVDLRQLPGTGPHARITREDVQRYVKHAMSLAGTATGAGFAVPGLPEIDFTQFGEISTQPLTKIQKISGRNLLRSWQSIPHVTQFDDADITELEEFRKKMRAERPETKLTLTTFFMKAVVVVLKLMPRFNSSLDKTGENLVLKQYFHVGVAVDTPNGLVVPVIRDVDSKGLHELALELHAVSERARARRLAPQDLQGAGITISSLGGIGGTYFTPIINPPEVAVLGVSRAVQRPVYVNGQLQPRLICGLSLSYDHRVIDGADAVRFTTRLREVLADIREMLL